MTQAPSRIIVFGAYGTTVRTRICKKLRLIVSPSSHGSSQAGYALPNTRRDACGGSRRDQTAFLLCASCQSGIGKDRFRYSRAILDVNVVNSVCQTLG